MPLDHLLDRELLNSALAAGLAQAPAQRFVVKQPMGAARELKPVADRNEIAGDAIDDQIAIAGDVRGDHGHGSRHGFQNGIRLAFVFAAEPQHIEMRHQPRHIDRARRENARDRRFGSDRDSAPVASRCGPSPTIKQMRIVAR